MDDSLSGLSAKQGLAAVADLLGAHRIVRVHNTAGAFAALLCARLAALPGHARPLVAVTADETAAQALTRDLRFFMQATHAADDPTADFGLGPVQYPLVFWKVVVVAVPQAAGAPGLKVFGFVLSQKDVVDKFGIEDFAPGRFSRYQQPLKAIEALTGVTFAASLHAVDASRVPPP